MKCGFICGKKNFSVKENKGQKIFINILNNGIFIENAKVLTFYNCYFKALLNKHDPKKCY